MPCNGVGLTVKNQILWFVWVWFSLGVSLWMRKPYIISLALDWMRGTTGVAPRVVSCHAE